MNLGKSIVALATAPARIGLVATEASLNLATAGLGLAKQTLGEGGSGSNAMANMLGIDDALARANRLARLLDDDAPLGRAIAPEGPLDRLLRPGGLVDLVTAPGGLLDRLTADGGGGLQRALQPGGLADRLLAEDGMIERLLSEDGVAERLLSEGGLVDKIAKDGPLEQLAGRRRHPQPARARDGGSGAGHRHAAGRGHVADLGGQPAEQHRRADSRCPGAEPSRRSSTRTVRSQRIIDARRAEPLGCHRLKPASLAQW